MRTVTRVITESPALLARERQVIVTLRGGARRPDRGRGRCRGRTRSSPAPSRTPCVGLHRALIAYVRERVAVGASASQIRRGVRAQAKRAFARLEDGLGEYAVKA